MSVFISNIDTAKLNVQCAVSATKELICMNKTLDWSLSITKQKAKI